jgi:hypothetical protein
VNRTPVLKGHAMPGKTQLIQRTSKNQHKKIPIQECYELRKKGVPTTVLADRYGCDKSAISHAMKPFTVEKCEIETFKEQRSNILAGKQRELLNALNAEVIEKMAGRDLAVAMGILFDKERLNDGLSTQNHAVIMASAVMEAERMSKRPLDVVVEGNNDAHNHAVIDTVE